MTESDESSVSDLPNKEEENELSDEQQRKVLQDQLKEQVKSLPNEEPVHTNNQKSSKSKKNNKKDKKSKKKKNMKNGDNNKKKKKKKSKKEEEEEEKEESDSESEELGTDTENSDSNNKKESADEIDEENLGKLQNVKKDRRRSNLVRINTETKWEDGQLNSMEEQMRDEIKRLSLQNGHDKLLEIGIQPNDPLPNTAEIQNEAVEDTASTQQLTTTTEQATISTQQLQDQMPKETTPEEPMAQRQSQTPIQKVENVQPVENKSLITSSNNVEQELRARIEYLENQNQQLRREIEYSQDKSTGYHVESSIETNPRPTIKEESKQVLLPKPVPHENTMCGNCVVL